MVVYSILNLALSSVQISFLEMCVFNYIMPYLCILTTH